MSNKWVAYPILIAGLIELIRPGSVGATVTIIAKTARQFYVSSQIFHEAIQHNQ
jgi:hypothetical protein